MRSLALIEKALPCDNDLTDPKIQTIKDVKEKGSVTCLNWNECKKRGKKENIFCSQRIGAEMAANLIKFHKIRNLETLDQVIGKEKVEVQRQFGEKNKFWVQRQGQWLVVKGLDSAINDIADFARTVLDFQANNVGSKIQEISLSQGKRVPEMSPEDALHNAALDIEQEGRTLRKIYKTD